MDSSIYITKLKKVLAKGSGIKVALFDARAKSVLGNVIPHSLFLEHSYFLFDVIGSQRSKMGQVTCSVFLEPASIPLLINELRDPCYESYFVYTLNTISDDELSLIASADTACVVREIYEIYVDVHQLDTHLFVLEPAMCPMDDLAVCAKRLCSLLKTIGVKPAIQTHPCTRDLAPLISDLMGGFDGKGACMLLLDRSMDMITPLLYEWRYQAMIYEYLEYHNGLVKVFNRTFSLFNDKFFDENKFCEISKVSESLRVCTAEMQNRRPAATSFLEDKTQGLETHLNIHNFILKECIKNAAAANAEYACINRDLLPCDTFLNDRDAPFDKKTKLFLVYLHSIGYQFDLAREEMLNDKILRLYPEYIEAVAAYSSYASKWVGKRYKHKFAPGIDPKLGYVPAVCRTVRKLLEKRLPGFEVLDGEIADSANVVVYIRGGITYSEYHGILNQIKRANVYVVSDYVIGHKDIMATVLKKGQ